MGQTAACFPDITWHVLFISAHSKRWVSHEVTSQVLMKLNIHQLYMTQFTVGHSSGRQRSVGLKNSLWSFEQMATGEPFLFCWRCFLFFCVFVTGIDFSAERFLISFHAAKTITYICACVFVHLCLCVCSRGVDLPVVRVFLPAGQSVGSHSWSQRCPHGRCTSHCGLLILLHRHLGEWVSCYLFFH